ncbi:hypothetical protein lerEdw1_016639 [Lerista edwardsae]|nr:hypothetical protein lerEdw1_016639 [Lerista edwardsae]
MGALALTQASRKTQLWLHAVTSGARMGGPPVNVGMNIDIASIDMVSEVNMQHKDPPQAESDWVLTPADRYAYWHTQFQRPEAFQFQRAAVPLTAWLTRGLTQEERRKRKKESRKTMRRNKKKRERSRKEKRKGNLEEGKNTYWHEEKEEAWRKERGEKDRFVRKLFRHFLGSFLLAVWRIGMKHLQLDMDTWGHPSWSKVRQLHFHMGVLCGEKRVPVKENMGTHLGCQVSQILRYSGYQAECQLD